MSDRPIRSEFMRAAGAASVVLACAGARVVAPASARDASQDAVAKLYDAAKKEGTVTWWTAHYAQDAAERVRSAFVAKYPGINVQFIRQTAQVVYQRTIQDLKSGTHELDVFASTDEAHYPALKKQGALATFIPPDVSSVPAAFRQLDPDNTYQIGALGFVIINYNRKRISSAPRRWADLLDPKYRGQVTTGHPGFSGYVGNWVLAMNDKYGWDYFKKLADNQPKIGRSVNDTVTDILAGERTIGAGPDNLSYEKKAAGDAIDVKFPDDGAILIVSPLAVMKNAPHPSAARLFMNFFYSKEYSEAMRQTFNFPLRADITAANGMRLDRITYYRNKLDRLTSGVPEVIQRWRETFGV